MGDSGRRAWGDLGYVPARLQGMNIVAGDGRMGAEKILCSASHVSGEGDNSVPHTARQIDDDLRLPPVELAWRGKFSAEVRRQYRNPDTNDGFDMAELVDHVTTSAFVDYGFNSGAGRAPPPGSSEALA